MSAKWDRLARKPNHLVADFIGETNQEAQAMLEIVGILKQLSSGSRKEVATYVASLFDEEEDDEDGA